MVSKAHRNGNREVYSMFSMHFGTFPREIKFRNSGAKIYDRTRFSRKYQFQKSTLVAYGLSKFVTDSKLEKKETSLIFSLKCVKIHSLTAFLQKAIVLCMCYSFSLLSIYS